MVIRKKKTEFGTKVTLDKGKYLIDTRRKETTVDDIAEQLEREHETGKLSLGQLRRMDQQLERQGIPESDPRRKAIKRVLK